MVCTASVQATRGLQDTPSEYAEEGTAAHMLAEQCLKSGADAGDCTGQEITVQSGSVFVVTDEMAEAVQVYLDYVRKIHKSLPDSELWVEREFHLSHIHAEMWGTCDAIVYQPMGKTYVIDYKHGAGHAVEAAGNAQMMFYGLGALEHSWDVTEVTLAIVQPRAFHRQGPVRETQIRPEGLVQWGQGLLKTKAAEAFGDAPKFVAGDHCTFCLHAPACVKLRESVNEHALTTFSPVEVAPIAFVASASLTDEQLGRTLDFADGLESWVKAVRSEAYARASRGQAPTGYKLVQGKGGNRKWADEDAVAAAIPDETIRCVTELRTPAQVEKMLKARKIKLDLSSLTVQSPGKPTLAPITDPRPAISAAPFTAVATGDTFLE
jgi:hypothetical protein